MTPNWKNLPIDFKKNVVKKLDFMSRHSLKSTSHLNRQIVNSTKFEVPRVRFGYKESKCLIVIYTGIEKFLRLELSGCKEGIIIHRSENSWDPNDISAKLLPTFGPLQTGFSILKSLFSQKSLKIETMEWEIGNDESIEEILKIFSKVDQKFHVKKMIFLWKTFAGSEKKLIGKLCDLSDLGNIERIALKISSGSLFPVMSYIQTGPGNCCGIPYYSTMISMQCKTEEMYEFTDRIVSRVTKNINGDKALATYSSVNLEPSKNQERKMERISKMGCVQRTIKTNCGEWTHIMSSRNEKKLDYLKYFEAEECGIGWLCKRCSDPFDYWYYQTLPRRIHQEPFWTGIVGGEGPAMEREMQNLKLKLERDEKQKERIQKGKKNNQKTKNQMTSWGFRHVSIENLMSNTKKNQEKKMKKKMKKLIRKGIVVKNSDDVSTSESTESPESSEIPESFEESEDVENLKIKKTMLDYLDDDVEEHFEDSEDILDYSDEDSEEEEILDPVSEDVIKTTSSGGNIIRFSLLILVSIIVFYFFLFYCLIF